MKHEEIEEIIPLYALDAVNSRERQEIEKHLETCGTCQILFEEYHQVTTGLLVSQPFLPSPAYLEERLLQRLDSPAGAASPAVTLSSWGSRLRGWLVPQRAFSAGLGAIAALLLLMNGVLLWQLNQTQQQVQQATTQSQQLRNLISEMSQQGSRTVVLQAEPNVAPDGKAAVIINPETTEAYLLVQSLPKLPQGRVYQIWLNDGKNRISGGLFTVDANGQAIVKIVAPNPLGNYRVLGITVEPDGGSPGPTSPRVIGNNL
ncbi:MAG: anti-sigma factor [Chloroflexi bacterium]|nr:anti-sigma factor [Chloroflexota bacterium]